MELHYCTGLSASEVCHNEIESVCNSVSVDGSVEIPPHCPERFGAKRLPPFAKPEADLTGLRPAPFIQVDQFELPQKGTWGGGEASSALIIPVPNNPIHFSQLALLLTNL